jgi:transcription antitermination factor NusG
MSGDATAATTNKQWFVVHTYSGFENKVKEAIESRAKIFGMGEKITRVLVPTEKVVEVRNKQKRETEQKFFPGYVLVEMELTDDTWHLVRSTPKVTGFVRSTTFSDRWRRVPRSPSPSPSSSAATRCASSTDRSSTSRVWSMI